MRLFLLAIGILVVAGTGSAGLAAEHPVWPLTVDSYLDLSVERLELLAIAWESGPGEVSEDLLALLYERYETTEEDYALFGSAQATAVANRLKSDEALTDRITTLQDRIMAAIQAKER